MLKKNLVTLRPSTSLRAGFVETSQLMQITGFDASGALSAGFAHPDGVSYLYVFFRDLIVPSALADM